MKQIYADHRLSCKATKTAAKLRAAMTFEQTAELIARSSRIAGFTGAGISTESGIPDFEVTVWQGYALPRGAPQKYVAAIHAAMMKALKSPELHKRFFDAGVSAAPQTPEAFRKFVEAETAKWKKAIDISGAKVD